MTPKDRIKLAAALTASTGRAWEPAQAYMLALGVESADGVFSVERVPGDTVALLTTPGRTVEIRAVGRGWHDRVAAEVARVIAAGGTS